MYAGNDGYYEFYNVSMHHNYALSSLISEVFRTNNEPVIDGSSIYSNEIITIEEFESEIHEV